MITRNIGKHLINSYITIYFLVKNVVIFVCCWNFEVFQTFDNLESRRFSCVVEEKNEHDEYDAVAAINDDWGIFIYGYQKSWPCF